MRGLRAAMTSAAAAVARAAGYTNAGTIEFLLDEDGRFYFLEMNTRLQVEHPITEMVTGLDLVRWQIRIARGERLDVDPAQAMIPRGHAMECRIYAEDPDHNFLPSPGRILQLRAPSGPGVRDDSGASAGLDVPIFYDPMISKLVCWAEDRTAVDRAHAASAWRVHRHRHQDHRAVLSVAAGAAGVHRPDDFTRPTWTRCSRRVPAVPFVEPERDARGHRRDRRGPSVGALVRGRPRGRLRTVPAEAAAQRWKTRARADALRTR